MAKSLRTGSTTERPVKHLVDIVGEWGYWQRHLLAYLFVLDIVAAFSNMGYSFHAFRMDFWCADVPWNYPNKTNSMKCFKFSNASQPCTKWNYDHSVYTSTIISEFDLVCDRSLLASLTQSFYMIGYVLAGATSFLSDSYGRRPIVFIFYFIEIISCWSCALSVNIYQYIFSRMFYGWGVVGRYVGIISLLVETTGPKYRSDIILISGIGWVIGYCFLPGFAVLVSNFRYMLVLSSAPIIIMVIWWYFLFESPRWLLVKGRFSEAEVIIKRALIRDKKFVSDSHLKEKMIMLKKHLDTILPKNQEAKQKTNILDLFKTKKIRLYLLVFCILSPINSLLYYGLSYNIDTFGGNFYVNWVLSGLVELPSQLICIWVLKYLGRINFVVVFSLIGTIAILLMIPIEARQWFSLLAKFSFNCAGWVLYLTRKELFPTVLRSTSDGAVVMISRVGAIAAPFITNLSQKTDVVYIFVMYAVLGSIFASLILLVPETKGRELPDTVLEVENFEKVNRDVKKLKKNAVV